MNARPEPSIVMVIAFSPDFSEEDMRVHVELCLAYSASMPVCPQVLHTVADVDALHASYGQRDGVVVWNMYMEVDAVSARLHELFGRRLVGSNHAVTQRTVTKVASHRVLEELGIPVPWLAGVADTRALGELLASPDLSFPVVVKVDRGYNSVGMSRASVCHTSDELRAQATLALRDHGAIVVQRFVTGREFTIAVANDRAYKPVEKVLGEGSLVYLPEEPYTKRYCTEPKLEAELRGLAERTARAFAIGPTEYCRIDIRQDPATGCLYPIDVNDMCSVWPESQFEVSLAGDGIARHELIHFLTLPARYVAARSRIRLYIVWSSDLSQIEGLLPFLGAFDCQVYLYPWLDAYDVMRDYFTERFGVPTFTFDLDLIMDHLEHEDRHVVVMFTESLDMPLGAAAKTVFEAIAIDCPKIIDVVCIGHCLDHSSCSACRSDVGHIPLKMTAHHNQRLPYSAEEARAAYAISSKTVLVSPTTGDDHIVLEDMRLLETMKRLQDEGRFEFLFKLHPSSLMMKFDDVHFQGEKAGIAYVQEHFRTVAPEHFSVFPIAEQIKIHITDLFSSMPAVLTHFGDRVILAKDNPSVRADHPIRPYLHLFHDAEQLVALLDAAAQLGDRNNVMFRRRYINDVRGDEDAQVASMRGWLASATPAPAELSRGWKERVKVALVGVRERSEQHRAQGAIDSETHDGVLCALGEWTAEPIGLATVSP